MVFETVTRPNKITTLSEVDQTLLGHVLMTEELQLPDSFIKLATEEGNSEIPDFFAKQSTMGSHGAATRPGVQTYSPAQHQHRSRAAERWVTAARSRSDTARKTFVGTHVDTGTWVCVEM